MYKGFTAQAGWLLIRPIPPDASQYERRGIALPQNMAVQNLLGEVLTGGPQGLCVYGAFAGEPFFHDGEDLLLIREADVRGWVTPVTDAI